MKLCKNWLRYLLAIILLIIFGQLICEIDSNPKNLEFVNQKIVVQIQNDKATIFNLNSFEIIVKQVSLEGIKRKTINKFQIQPNDSKTIKITMDDGFRISTLKGDDLGCIKLK